jgi:glycosyltransferase involved in cell wall biosynthesis
MEKTKSIISLASCPFRQQPVLRKEARTLIQAGWKVTIIAWDRKNLYPAYDTIDEVAVENIQIRGSYGIGGFDMIVKTLFFWFTAFFILVKKRKIYTIIHCQDLNTILPAYLGSRLLGKVVVFDSHDPYPEMLSLTQSAPVVAMARWVEKFFCRRVDAILTVNGLMKKRFQKITQRPIYIVYNYPELEFFKAGVTPRGKEALVIGRIGTLAEELGIEETIAAFKAVADDFNVRLLFVGRLADSMQERFYQLIEPVRDRVQCIADIPYFQVPAYYEQMDISMVLYGRRGISPYVSPMKLFESMAMGVPVIASNVGEVRPLVEAVQCGLVVPSGDVDATVAALQRLLSDAALRRQMGQNGLAKAQAEQNWEMEGRKLIKMYEDLLALSSTTVIRQ